MAKNNGGGSATNSGIDFQQRVAACFQIFLYTEFKISQVLDEDFSFTIESIHFETADSIDDLKLLCNKGRTLYLQIKRYITFSDLVDSEFIKTLDQFIEQYAKGSTKEYFVLVTSTDSSRRIIGELRKILTAIRLNDTTFKLNPLNKNEREVYMKFEIAFYSRYEGLSGHQPNESQFIEFAKRVYVEVMDVETGMPLEKSVKLLLADRMQSPDLIWALLIKNSLSYAANRASINKKALAKVLNNYQLRKNPVLDLNEFEALIRDSVSLHGDYSCDKEVLILESEKDNRYQIIEIGRFTTRCEKRISFSNNKAMIGDDKDGFSVIYRGSSVKGLERFIEQNPNTLKNKQLLIHDSPKIETNSQLECIKLYREYLEELSNENRNISACLHCGKSVGQSQNLLIEIDDKDTPSALGVCHIACRRPMDRVLGTVHIEGGETSPYLEGFNFKEWVSLSMKGGIMVSGLNPASRQNAIIAWSGFQLQKEGDYCVKFKMEDGTKRFAFHRGKIERMSKQEAIEQVKKIKDRITEHKVSNDPIGFTTKNVTYGVYSILLPNLDSDDEFIAISDAEPVRYSQQEAKSHDSGRMYYAPICLAVDINDGSILNIENLVPIISDPLKIDSLAKSWQKAGIDVSNLGLRILRSDNEVDIILSELFSDKMFPVLDPLLDQNGSLIGGYPFERVEEFGKLEEEFEGSNDNEFTNLRSIPDPIWRKHDLVMVVFPENAKNKKLFGKLLDDETENETGTRFVIFQPLENGELIEDVHLAIPSKFISKWDGQ